MGIYQLHIRQFSTVESADQQGETDVAKVMRCPIFYRNRRADSSARRAKLQHFSRLGSKTNEREVAYQVEDEAKGHRTTTKPSRPVGPGGVSPYDQTDNRRH